MHRKPLIPIILCGGSGSRLWPLSRESFPKQYLSFNSKDNKTLLQKTQERISGIKDITKPILICNEEHRFIVAEQMKEINVEPISILLEPMGRNTCAAITLAAIKSLKLEDNPNLLILSSDHEIQNTKKFVQAIENGINFCDNGKLVTYGIVPNAPETGYGYIQAQNPLDTNKVQGEKIKRFLEKPDLTTAKKLIKDKHYAWNSGIFLFSAKSILSEVEFFLPSVKKFCEDSLSKDLIDLDFQRIEKKSFSKCPNVSIDIAVMEKTEKGIVLPLDAGWRDLGSWNAVWDSSDKDKNGNFLQGNIVSKENKNCYFRSENKLIVGMGLKDLIVIDTRDATLITSKNNSQDIKSVVTDLKRRGIKEGQIHKKIFRPWGNYESIAEDLRWQVKLITVKPGNKLSLQMHHHRAEHWVVVKGTAKVQIDENEIILGENESTFIPLGSKHRLINPGKIPLVLIEVQSGAYLGEDDITRFEDNYGRTNN